MASSAPESPWYSAGRQRTRGRRRETTDFEGLEQQAPASRVVLGVLLLFVLVVMLIPAGVLMQAARQLYGQLFANPPCTIAPPRAQSVVDHEQEQPQPQPQPQWQPQSQRQAQPQQAEQQTQIRSELERLRALLRWAGLRSSRFGGLVSATGDALSDDLKWELATQGRGMGRCSNSQAES